MLGMQQPGGMPVPPAQYTLGMSTGEMGAAPMAYKTQASPGPQGMVDPASNVAFPGRQQQMDQYLIGQNMGQNGMTASVGSAAAAKTNFASASSAAATEQENVNRIKDDYLLNIIRAQGGDQVLMDAANLNTKAIALGRIQSAGMDSSTIGGQIAKGMMA